MREQSLAAATSNALYIWSVLAWGSPRNRMRWRESVNTALLSGSARTACVISFLRNFPLPTAFLGQLAVLGFPVVVQTDPLPLGAVETAHPPLVPSQHPHSSPL